MARNILVAIWGLIFTLCMLTGTARADCFSGNMPARQHAADQDPGKPAQVQVATPTPQPSAEDETSVPIQSEAGQDYSLVIGAIVLVLIVIVGVILGTRRQPHPKAGD